MLPPSPPAVSPVCGYLLAQQHLHDLDQEYCSWKGSRDGLLAVEGERQSACKRELGFETEIARLRAHLAAVAADLSSLRHMDGENGDHSVAGPGDFSLSASPSSSMLIKQIGELRQQLSVKSAEIESLKRIQQPVFFTSSTPTRIVSPFGGDNHDNTNNNNPTAPHISSPLAQTSSTNNNNNNLGALHLGTDALEGCEFNSHADKKRKADRPLTPPHDPQPTPVPQSAHARRTLSLLSSIKRKPSTLKLGEDDHNSGLDITPKRKLRSTLLEEDSFTATVKGTDTKIIFDDDSELFDENAPISLSRNANIRALVTLAHTNAEAKRASRRPRKRKLKATVIALDADENHPDGTLSAADAGRSKHQTRTRPLASLAGALKKNSPLKAQNEQVRGVFRL